MKIVIDHRERNSFVIEELENLGVQCEIRHLPLADYLLNEEIAIERKTVSDFTGSMISKRLISQLTDMKNNYKKYLLIIEGVGEEDIYKPSMHPNINENAIRGMLLSIALDFEFPMIFTKDAEDTAKYLCLLLKRIERPEREYGLLVKRKTHTLKDRQQMLIESFPGVGPGLAKGILNHFGSVKKFADASIKELTEVPKIGKKKAAKIREIIDSSYT